MELAMQVFVDWTALMVPALALWAVIGIHVYRSEGQSALVDALYFLVMVVIAALTWRTMNANDSCWLIHTASLGTMIVGGVLPKRGGSDDTFNLISQID
jgi:hypothetical protein